MASKLERLQLAALRLREIHREAAEIYRTFPELDRRPSRARAPRATTTDRRDPHNVVSVVKLH